MAATLALATRYKNVYWWLHGGYMSNFQNFTCYCFYSELLSVGARDRNRTGTPVIHEAADFKSDVSTYFTTRAQQTNFGTKRAPSAHVNEAFA